MTFSGRQFRVSILATAYLFIATLLNCASAFAQDERDVIKVPTDLVTFEITVTDANGKPVRGLKANDLRVLDNGREREIAFFEPVTKGTSGRPLAIVFALDTSGSMTDAEMDRLKASIRSFADRLSPYNASFAVVTFAMNVRTLQPFTNRIDKLSSTVQKLKRDRYGLSTHGYDAIDHSLRLLVNKGPRAIGGVPVRRVVVAVTDGFPVGDVVGSDTVIERANAAETTVFSIIMPSYSSMHSARKPLPTPFELSGLMERTGGRSFYATGGELTPLFGLLEEEITASYSVAFYPQKGSGAAGEFRNVKVTSRTGATVRQDRSGYRMP